jgi:hypothetical protein
LAAGHMLDEPIAKEARAAIDFRGIEEARRLFEFQGSRLEDAGKTLLFELQKRERWAPDREVRLRLEDCDGTD